ncbi:MAG: GNAT family N-acetyltransferase [Gammaproteobacteria bacterium]|nr:GNAT family N-acetyltransferase [Gammaproteobacteria bacterium]
MEIRIRLAVASDKEAIAAFTRTTFTWGDYVTDEFDQWLNDPRGQTAVAVGPDDIPIAMARWSLLSPTEVWGQGARVHPDHRRKGISSRLTEAGEQWARKQGALVLRLVTEVWNTAAQAQVTRSGFRNVSRWTMWERPVGDAAPRVAGNGGSHVPSDDRLTLAGESEAGPAYLAWSVGSMAVVSHGFITEQWTWRRMHARDLVAAARRRALWVCPAGWLIGEVDDDRSDTFRVSWVMAAPDDVYRLLRAAIDRASETAERIVFLLPKATWTDQAARRAGLDVGHQLLVYERPIT